MSRRDFLRLSALSAGSVVVSTGLAGCGRSDNSEGRGSGSDADLTPDPDADTGPDTGAGAGSNSEPDTEPAPEAPAPVGPFRHGIASGDPEATGLMLWTRVTPSTASTSESAVAKGSPGRKGNVDNESTLSVLVGWEVATDADFNNVVNNGESTTDASRDFTLKVDVRNLQPGSHYFYRFHANDTPSAVGRARTLPQGSVDSLRLGVVSCSNYAFGRFHVYSDLARTEDIAAILHLGDYIYEYAAGTYPTTDAIAPGRDLPAELAGEALTLDDYRRRYALYRTDPDLQAAHASAPFIVVWDDHEVANDTWREGAENHDASEGDFRRRKEAALQAWFEWTPVRPLAEGDQETIYRRFDFGDLVSLHMLDTRHQDRDEPLDYADYSDIPSRAFDQAGFTAAQTDSNRSLLGAEQSAWLDAQLSESQARWQVLGQQVLMGRMNVPIETIVFRDGSTLFDLVRIKSRILRDDPRVTEDERRRVENLVPYNLDAWDGYFAERERLLERVRDLDHNLIVLAGDTHNGWASNLRTVNGERVGVEFATPAVTSPGIAPILGLDTPLSIIRGERAFTTLVDDLDYSNLGERGWLQIDLTPEQATARWHYHADVTGPDRALAEERDEQRFVRPGAQGRMIEE